MMRFEKRRRLTDKNTQTSSIVPWPFIHPLPCHRMLSYVIALGHLWLLAMGCRGSAAAPSELLRVLSPENGGSHEVTDNMDVPVRVQINLHNSSRRWRPRKRHQTQPARLVSLHQLGSGQASAATRRQPSGALRRRRRLERETVHDSGRHVTERDDLRRLAGF